MLPPSIIVANGQYGPYKWRSYEETWNLSMDVARGIEKLGLAAQEQYQGADLRLIGIYSKNREEWAITDFACWMMSVTNVPLYDTLGEESICWTFEQTSLKTIFLSVQGIAKLVAIKRKGGIKTLANLVCFDEVDPETRRQAEEVGVKVISFSDVVSAGKSEPTMKLRRPTGNTLITICYTSGTTDRAKGVEITQKNFRDSAAASYRSGLLHFGPEFTILSYLPLAHVFERVVFYIGIMGGFKIAFFHGELAQLKDDICAAQPHGLVGVPRVFSRFYDAIMGGINATKGFKRKLVMKAINAKSAEYKKSGKVTHWFYDRFVLKKIREAMGNRLNTFVSAAAPMESNMMETMRILFSAYFLQGYGQTETAGAIAISYSEDNYPGSTGPPLMCCTGKLVDVPEMDYKSTDMVNGVPMPRGELCVKGTHVTRGYFKDPEKTSALLDADGWMHTGDIVAVPPSGIIMIIDRKKNMFKLNQGEYVAPEKIENVLVNCKWILQVFVYGDSYQTYLLAVVVPKKEEVLAWGKEKGLGDNCDELCKNKELVDTVLKDMTKISREQKVC